MNLLAAIPRRAALRTALAVGGVLALLLFISLAYGPLQQHERPTPSPRPRVAVTPGTADPSEQQAAQVAVSFAQAYFSSHDVRPYLTAAEERAWTQQASRARRVGVTVAEVNATFEGVAADGSLAFIVDASVNAGEQAVEVFVVDQNGHYLVARVSA